MRDSLRFDNSQGRRLSGFCLAFWLAAISTGPSVGQTVDYAASLRSPGGDLRFGLRLEFDGLKLLAASLLNGTECQPVSDLSWQSDSVILRFPHYNSEIKATVSDERRRLEGTWTKRSGPKTSEMKFLAEHISNTTIDASAKNSPLPEQMPADFAGRWQVKFESSPDLAVGIFDVVDSKATGTFLTTTGDYRYLAGQIRDGKLQLATFDGAHAFLFDAQLNKDGTLAGDFWSGMSWHESWTATKDEKAQLPDGFDQVHLASAADWSKIAVRDLNGTSHSLAEKADAFGNLTIINVFGSWCPNCHDEAPLLVELQREFGPKGLKVIGLAFEAAGEFEADVAQVNRFVARHSITYPIFLAGESDKEKASRALPFLEKVKAFPTSIFVNRAGKVVAIYSGFSGPATGPAHEDLKRRFDTIIRRELELHDQ